MSRSNSDSYANPINGASVTVSGGYGANVAGATDANGYYNLALKPTSIGGPFALSFAVTSTFGNFNTIQGSITVISPIVVPVDKVLSGTTIAGQTGTLPNMVTANPNGMGVGRSAGLQYWTGGGSTVYLKPQKGYYDGIDTWTYYNEPNLVPSNILSGKKIFDVEGSLTMIEPGNTVVLSYTKTFSVGNSPLVRRGPRITMSQPGAFTLSFRMWTSHPSSEGTVVVYKNGVATGTPRIMAWTESSKIYTENFTCNIGDYFEFYMMAGPATYGNPSGVLVNDVQVKVTPIVCGTISAE